MTEHATFHMADAIDGKVTVGCSCGWREEIDVRDCDYFEGLRRIYGARDWHEFHAETDGIRP